MQVLENQAFTGKSTGSCVVNAVITGSATLQAKAADGTWVNVPDGAVTDTVFSFYAQPTSIFRFTGLTGTVDISK